MFVKDLLYLIHVQFLGQLAADLADGLKVGKALPAQVDATEKLPLQVPIEMFHQAAVGPSRIVFQEHQGQFALRGKDAGRALFGFLEPKGPHQVIPGNPPVDLPQIAAKEAIVEDVKLFCLGRKGKGVLKIGYSSYFVHN
tara:strand:+ start:1095 stop:1514 length:420 start_codon:yes stop_codon:yes gene_type:complete